MNRKTLLVGALLAALPTAALAEGFSWNATLASDYIYRGIDQNDDQPALQLGLDYGFANGFYVGAWGSNVDFGDSTDIEIDTYVGWSGALTDTTSIDLKLTRYNYLNEPTGVDYAYNELIGTFGFGETYSATLAYTNNYLNADLDSVYVGLAGSWALNETYTFNANAGWTSIAGPLENYFDYGISLSRSFGPATVSLGYVTSSDGAETNFGRDASEDKVLLTIGFGG